MNVEFLPARQEDVRWSILECLDGTQDPDADAPSTERLHGWVDPTLAHSEFWEALNTLEAEGRIDIYGLKDGQGWIVRWVRLKTPDAEPDLDLDELRAETARLRSRAA